MSENKKLSLRNNMFIFAIGVFLTKILNFIFAPIYSYHLSTSEFGTIDIFSTAAFLIIPIVTLAITEAVLKYGIDDKSDLKKVFSSGLFVDAIGILLIIIFSFVLGHFFYRDNLLPVMLYFVFECFFLYMQAFTRAQKNTIAYASSSVIYCVISISMIMFFIAFRGMGINGYFYGLSIGIFITIIYLLFVCKVWKYFSFKCIEKITIFRMLKYSAPLVISNISYWVISGSDKYITNFLMGSHYNGLLSIVHKIPTLCTLFFSIFNYAYVMSALKDHKLSEETFEEDNKFYSTIFRYILVVLIIGSLFVSLMAYPVTQLYDVAYREAWVFIPLYSFGVIFGETHSFFTSIYCTKEKTLKVMLIVMTGAIINAGSCFLIMKFMDLGLWSTAISTFLSNTFVFAFYYFDSKKYVILKLRIKEIIGLLVCASISILSCFDINLIIYYIIASIAFLAIVALNIKDIIEISKKIVPKLGYNKKQKRTS